MELFKNKILCFVSFEQEHVIQQSKTLGILLIIQLYNNIKTEKKANLYIREPATTKY